MGLNRVLSFGLLGPFAGAVTCIAMLWINSSLLMGHPWSASHSASGPVRFILFTIFMSYVVGIIPAGLVGWLDSTMTGRPLAIRLLAVALAGYAAAFFAFLIPLALLNAFKLFLEIPCVAGMIGVVPAVVCSWLSSGKRA